MMAYIKNAIDFVKWLFDKMPFWLWVPIGLGLQNSVGHQVPPGFTKPEWNAALMLVSPTLSTIFVASFYRKVNRAPMPGLYYLMMLVFWGVLLTAHYKPYGFDFFLRLPADGAHWMIAYVVMVLNTAITLWKNDEDFDRLRRRIRMEYNHLCYNMPVIFHPTSAQHGNQRFAHHLDLIWEFQDGTIPLGFPTRPMPCLQAAASDNWSSRSIRWCVGRCILAYMAVRIMLFGVPISTAEKLKRKKAKERKKNGLPPEAAEKDDESDDDGDDQKDSK
jgi:hypothetical protein